MTDAMRYSRYEQAKMLVVKLKNLHPIRQCQGKPRRIEVSFPILDRDLIVEALEFWSDHHWEKETTGRKCVNDDDLDASSSSAVA
jgi:hypothetical protein